MTANPFFEDWTTPFDAPPFDRITPEHFRPAYDRALAEHAAEIAAHRGRSGRADASRTRSSRWRIAAGCSARSRRCSAIWPPRTPTTRSRQIERDMAPVLAKHWNDIYLNAALVQAHRCAAAAAPSLGLDDESRRVLERYHLDFVRAGAKLEGAARERYAAIIEELATLGTTFGQNVLADEQAFVLPLQGERSRRRAAISRARPRRRRRRNAGSMRPMRSPRRARASSRYCSSPTIASCARRSSRPGLRAATTPTRTTTAS